MTKLYGCAAGGLRRLPGTSVSAPGCGQPGPRGLRVHGGGLRLSHGQLVYPAGPRSGPPPPAGRLDAGVRGALPHACLHTGSQIRGVGAGSLPPQTAHILIEIPDSSQAELRPASLKPLTIYFHYALRAAPRMTQFCPEIFLDISIRYQYELPHRTELCGDFLQFFLIFYVNPSFLLQFLVL